MPTVHCSQFSDIPSSHPPPESAALVVPVPHTPQVPPPELQYSHELQVVQAVQSAEPVHRPAMAECDPSKKRMRRALNRMLGRKEYGFIPAKDLAFMALFSIRCRC